MSSRVDTAVRKPSDAEVQAMLAKAVHLYAERAATTGTSLTAFPPDAAPTATDVMVVCTAMLKALNLQVFELGMWQSWSGRQQ